MSVRIEIEPVDYYCQFCDSAMVETGCIAPTCSGHACLQCDDVGCDLDNDDGNCALAYMQMPYAQRLAAQEERLFASRFGRPVRTVNLP